MIDKTLELIRAELLEPKLRASASLNLHDKNSILSIYRNVLGNEEHKGNLEYFIEAGDNEAVERQLRALKKANDRAEIFLTRFAQGFFP